MNTSNSQILVVNCGSSSLKLSLFQHGKKELRRLLDAHLKGINSENAHLEISSSSPKRKQKEQTGKKIGIAEGLHWILDILEKEYDFKALSIKGIGHRFVNGGSQYVSSVRIDQKVINGLEALSELAPLHNDACLEGIKASREYFGDSIPQVVVFDTAFHRTMPDVASQYAIGDEITSKYPIKRYGFHGISNAFLWEAYSKYAGENESRDVKVITLHLGNGCSATAIRGGASIDTSMGFTPAEGLVMGTRAGDVDVAIVEFLCRNDEMSATEVMDLLNNRSGLLGVSGISSEMKELVDLYDQNKRAKLAVDMFCYRAVKYLGAYLAALGGANAIIFSGGIGENASKVREMIVQQMAWLGVKLDGKLNNEAIDLEPGKVVKISQGDSFIEVIVIGTDENLYIANEVAQKQ